MQISKKPVSYIKFITSFYRIFQKNAPTVIYYATSIDAIDAFTNELIHRQRSKEKNKFSINDLNIRYFMEKETKIPSDTSKMSIDELDNILLKLLSKNKNKEITQLMTDCTNLRKFINEITLKKLYRNFSIIGKPETVVLLQNYSMKVIPNAYKRNGEFLHYLAKAHCMKGNSERGLFILKDAYKNNENLRSLYRIIFRELIHDSVLNRSEASLVIFKKYVLEFSEEMREHYPLVCFWHICWSSTWFSDQMLANELLETSKTLQNIVRDKATAFSITILKQEYNEDAVIQLLQALLKYNMMTEYVKVLQVLFAYKLKNRDLRGCTEIIRNCTTLGLNLPAEQQGRYIRMLIDGKQDDKQTTTKPESKNFKLKF